MLISSAPVVPVLSLFCISFNLCSTFIRYLVSQYKDYEFEINSSKFCLPKLSNLHFFFFFFFFLGGGGGGGGGVNVSLESYLTFVVFILM